MIEVGEIRLTDGRVATFGSGPAFSGGNVKGISPSEELTSYEFSMRSIGDHQFATYTIGVGLTSYVYGHHGSVSEVDMKLVEFHLQDR